MLCQPAQQSPTSVHRIHELISLELIVAKSLDCVCHFQRRVSSPRDYNSESQDAHLSAIVDLGTDSVTVLIDR